MHLTQKRYKSPAGQRRGAGMALPSCHSQFQLQICFGSLVSAPRPPSPQQAARPASVTGQSWRAPHPETLQITSLPAPWCRDSVAGMSFSVPSGNLFWLPSERVKASQSAAGCSASLRDWSRLEGTSHRNATNHQLASAVVPGWRCRVVILSSSCQTVFAP